MRAWGLEGLRQVLGTAGLQTRLADPQKAPGLGTWLQGHSKLHKPPGNSLDTLSPKLFTLEVSGEVVRESKVGLTAGQPANHLRGLRPSCPRLAIALGLLFLHGSYGMGDHTAQTFPSPPTPYSLRVLAVYSFQLLTECFLRAVPVNITPSSI